MAEELTIHNIIQVLEQPRDLQKPWMTSTGIAKRILGRTPTKKEAIEVQNSLLEYLKSPNPEVRYSSLPSKKTLEVLWGAFPHVKQRVLQSLHREDVPDGMFETLDPSLPKCFISHSFKDIGKIKEIAKILIGKGIYPWLAESDLDQGDIINDSLIRAIDECKYFVGFITRNALESAWTRKEILTTLTHHQVPIESMELIIDGDDADLVRDFQHWRSSSPFTGFNPQYNNLLNEFLSTKGLVYWYSATNPKSFTNEQVEFRSFEEFGEM